MSGTYRSADKVRKNIVSTGARLFKEYGADKTTVKMISDELGVAPGTVTYHFRRKSEFLRNLLLDFL
jgi:AcrR family transcriptional regulator